MPTQAVHQEPQAATSQLRQQQTRTNPHAKNTRTAQKLAAFTEDEGT